MRQVFASGGQSHVTASGLRDEMSKDDPLEKRLWEFVVFQHLSEFSGFACFQTLGSEKDRGGEEALKRFFPSLPRVSSAILSLRIDRVVTRGEESETRSHDVA